MPATDKITKDTIIAEVIRICPAALMVFERHGMECFRCVAASTSTVEEGAAMHDVDLDALLEELNSACEGEDCD